MLAAGRINEIRDSNAPGVKKTSVIDRQVLVIVECEHPDIGGKNI